MSRREFDLFVIGGGSGGVRAARAAARHGARVAVAEESRIGGTCVIRGCVPKKLMVYAARYADEFADSVGFGWTPGAPAFDWATMLRNIDREIDRLNQAYIRGLETAGAEIIHSRATIVAPTVVRIEATGEEVEARNIVVATGGRPNRADDIPGGELAITSDDMFRLETLPLRILIVGAGFVAIEFAAVMAGLGVATTVLHRGEEILRPFDRDMQRMMHESMERRGIAIRTRDELAAIERTPTGLLARTTAGAAIEADQVLMAIGRTPNTTGFGLAETGVAVDPAGAIMVDRHCRTTVPHIFAVGDVTNRVNLTPVAVREGQAVADTLFGGRETEVDHADIPHAVFGTPEIGAVGLTEETAREQYPSLDIYRAEFLPLRNRLSGRADRTLIKLLVDAATDRIVGCHIFGPEAAELIQLVGIVVKMRGRKADLDSVIALHPTAAEEIVTMREPSERVRRAAAE
ncbi:MAG: glutathione-disulfide reductase [Bauldia sp.]|nr:glutathione-disulfide reductase [Bauldia sp.]